MALLNLCDIVEPFYAGVYIQAMTKTPETVHSEISTTEAAELIGCAAARVRKLLALGILKGRKLTMTVWAVDRASVVAYAAIPQTRGRPRTHGKHAKRD